MNTKTCCRWILITLSIFSCASYKDNKYDETIKNGWYEIYLDENLRVMKKASDASYLRYVYYDNGILVTRIANGILGHEYSRIMSDGKLDKLTAKDLHTNKPQVLNGTYASFNRNGKRSSIQQFKNGQPYGSFIYYDKSGRYIETIQEFNSSELENKHGYVYWDKQIGTGHFLYRFTWDKHDGKWEGRPLFDSLNQTPYEIIFYLDNDANNVFKYGKIYINDSLMIELDQKQFVRFKMNTQSIALMSLYNTEEISTILSRGLNVFSLSCTKDGNLMASRMDITLWHSIREIRGLKLLESSNHITESFIYESN